VQLGANNTSASVASTRIIIDRALVLGLGQTTQTHRAEVTQGEVAISVALVTLAVTQRQAELLVHAVQTGAIYFALLRDGTTVTSPRTITDLYLYGQK
jgi:Flp pilus assembly protein CpaB